MSRLMLAGVLIAGLLPACSSQQARTANAFRDSCGSDWAVIYPGMKEDRLRCAMGQEAQELRQERARQVGGAQLVTWRSDSWLDSVTTYNGRVVSWRESAASPRQARSR
jgi:hypothetical protein